MALETTKGNLIIRDCGIVQSANIINKLQLINMVVKFLYLVANHVFWHQSIYMKFIIKNLN
jgi:hypothetical protein